ncbi:MULTISPECIES: DUF503 domain-containing protein [Aerococcus]|nr:MULTISPECIES: DUF503 domain-containing protein [Aerococcus]MDK6368707.1 DUF503 domain-containing protein [Aerococcus sp. UMB9870]MDK6679255.1 DUF503 domain-containing protein [Aerococcus sp. UMB8608]MDK6685903.1 DUF503 domain-containing protein [Aerococcus sp. UMB8623]MDK6939330.1 DUF503 domain-containing protein [Aerococcus sp. UMB8487]OFK19188.1 hypothetical protein HMPREF2829_01255 [Aerococcus sp. HMSC072A12]
MYVLAFELTCRLSGIHSLKEKRRLVKSICQRCQRKYGVSAAEIAYLDDHQFMSLGFALVSNSYSKSRNRLLQLKEEVELTYPIQLVACDWYEGV